MVLLCRAFSLCRRPWSGEMLLGSQVSGSDDDEQAGPG